MTRQLSGRLLTNEKTYVRQVTTKSHCGSCARNLTLLIPNDPGPADSLFYICWNCKKISQAGIGEVEEAVD